MNRKKHNKDRMRRVLAMICAAFIIVAFVASIVLPAMAATEQQLNDAKSKTQQAKKDAENAENKKKAVLAEYNSIDKQISDTETEIDILEKQIEQTKNDIVLKEEELKKAEEEYNEYEELFLTRARVMYENSEIKYLEILFGANDFSDFLSKLEMISQLMDYDKGILSKLEETKKKISGRAS